MDPLNRHGAKSEKPIELELISLGLLFFESETVDLATSKLVSN